MFERLRVCDGMVACFSGRHLKRHAEARTQTSFCRGLLSEGFNCHPFSQSPPGRERWHFICISYAFEQSAQERIALSLTPDGSGRAMAGKHLGIRRHGEQMAGDAFQ